MKFRHKGMEMSLPRPEFGRTHPVHRKPAPLEMPFSKNLPIEGEMAARPHSALGRRIDLCNNIKALGG